MLGVIMNNPEIKDIDAALRELDESNSAIKLDPLEILEIREIQEKLASVEVDIPIPEDLSKYPESVAQYFIDHIVDEDLKVNISISPLESHPDRQDLLNQIAMNLKRGILNYFGPQIESAGEDKAAAIIAMIGERVENVRYSEENPILSKITVILQRQLGRINIDLINAANTPPDKFGEVKKAEDSHDDYTLHGRVMFEKAKRKVVEGGLVGVYNSSSAIIKNNEPAETVGYEEEMEIDIKLPAAI